MSCADSRWDENFSAILASHGIKIRYEFDSTGLEATKVVLEDDEIELRKYLEEKVDKSVHELIRTNVLNATRNYNHRVKAFVNEIILNKNNPMAAEHYSTKVEFQGRGAGHNHGTIWVNLKKMEYYFQEKNGNWIDLLKIVKEKIKKCDDAEKLFYRKFLNDLKMVLDKKN